MRLDRSIQEQVSVAVEAAIDEKLLPVLLREMAISFRKQPQAQLTPLGFSWAVTLAFQKRWPNVSHEEANSWMRAYLEVPYGTHGYEWTAAAADEVTAAYISDFGEATL